MVDHTLRAFDADLQMIKSKIIARARFAQQQIVDAVGALANHDIALAHRARATDPEVDRLQNEIDQMAIGTIARRQPLADDLRILIGAMRIANDLERIGDLAASIGKRAIQMADHVAPTGIGARLQRMEEFVLKQFEKVLGSCARGDAEESVTVWRKDQELDALNDSVFRKLLTYMMEDSHNITLGSHLVFSAKNLERIGDHLTNSAESVYYIVHGTAIPGERPKVVAV